MIRPNRDELEVRRFAGNGDVLCDLGHCPFNSVVDNKTAFCSLFRTKLSYEETGNNDLCRRCKECFAVDGYGD